MKNTAQRIALITGANRGIGREVAKQLAQNEVIVVLTGRNTSQGEKASQELNEKGGKTYFHPLDVLNQKSLDHTYDYIFHEFGRLDILINNAGVYLDHSGPSNPSDNRESASLLNTPLGVIRETFETNTLGPLRLIQKFAPLMKQNKYGRIVNVSSGMGQLSEMEGGWPGYRISKTALNAVTRMLAAEVKDSGILVNSVCPGWVKTDMGGPNAELTVEEGADTIVWLANLPNDGPNGGFFRERKPIEW